MITRRAAPLINRSLVAVISAVIVTACGTSDHALPDYNPEPVEVGQPAPEVDKADLQLPLQLEQNRLVDPDWQTPPRYLDDVFLSAADAEEVLTFRAVDTTGTTLWEAERPLSCTGFTLSSTNGEHYAVLTDIRSSDDSFGETTASAYDLHTGNAVWGPVNVPGPHQGPGTVFAAPTDEAMGEAGPKVVLDPATGEVLLDETEQTDTEILGEFHGTVLIAHQEQVQAYDRADLAESGLESEPVWTIGPGAFGWEFQDLAAASPATIADPDDSAVVIGTDETNRALIDVDTGDIIATDLTDAAQDPSSSTWVTVGQELAGYDLQGQQLYAEPHDGLDIIGVGGAMAYMENSAGDLQVHNVVTGEIGTAYDSDGTGTLTVPTIISPGGSGVLDAGGQYYLSPVDP